VRQHELRHQEDAGDVHAQDSLPALERGLVECAHAADAGVVEEHVDALVVAGDAVGKLPRLDGVGDVGDADLGDAALGADLPDCFLGALPHDVGHDDLRAFARE
jgi:hypothetical protein